MKTKICATIGPACGDFGTLRLMIENGLRIARLNFSHGDHARHAETIKNLRAAAESLGVSVPIMQDLTGPRLRVGVVPEAGINTEAGKRVRFSMLGGEFENDLIPLNYPELHEHLKIGERILIDDGRFEGRITKISPEVIEAEVVEASLILSNKGLNFPDSVLEIPVLRAKDIGDLRFGLKQGVEMVAMSFVKNAHDLVDARLLIRQILSEAGGALGRPPLLIAKIEHQEAVRNIEEIAEAADGLMVARGDLGLEIPQARVPMVQKKIIQTAHAFGKSAMVATQLLDSMRHNRRPTRAEVSDVANAVLDGADSLMFSNETAVGAHPDLVVKTAAEIINQAEAYLRELGAV